MASVGRLVKSQGRVVSAQTLNAQLDAREIRAAAVHEADTILAQAHAAAGALREEAVREGAAAGRAAAKEEFHALLGSAVAEAERVRREAIPFARLLAVRMAERIIGRALELEPGILTDIVQRAVVAATAVETRRRRSAVSGRATAAEPDNGAGATGAVVVRVHPDDVARLAVDRSRLAASLAPGLHLQLVADASVDRSGCVVDTPGGRLDARLQTQLGVLARAAFAVPGQASGE